MTFAHIIMALAQNKLNGSNTARYTKNIILNSNDDAMKQINAILFAITNLQLPSSNMYGEAGI